MDEVWVEILLKWEVIYITQQQEYSLTDRTLLDTLKEVEAEGIYMDMGCDTVTLL